MNNKIVYEQFSVNDFSYEQFIVHMIQNHEHTGYSIIIIDITNFQMKYLSVCKHNQQIIHSVRPNKLINKLRRAF